jgi:hypothetical protein
LEKKHKVVVILTFISYLLAIVTSCLWLIFDCPRLEPIAVILVLLTAGFGSYFQFKISPMLVRVAQLKSLVHELAKNMSIYLENYQKGQAQIPIILPQYHLSAMESCLSMGALDPVDDIELFNLLHDVHDRIRQINTMLSIEQSKFQTTGKNEEVYINIIDGGAMLSIKEALLSLQKAMADKKYQELHEVDANTILFPESIGSE